MKHLDLFSGIGGFALACQWNGIETIGFVEIDKYCQKVLRKHWPDVPIVEDIRDVEKIKRIVEGRTVTLATAGFPCQPFSVAGKRGGKEDDRYLWPETLAVIKAIKPDWILLENVTGIINLALDQVLSDLEGASYATETLIIPACAVNAWHRRDRVWVICHATGNGLNDSQTGEGVGPRNQRGKEGENEVCQPERAGSSRNSDANSQRERLEGADTEREVCPTGQPLQSSIDSEGNGIQSGRPVIDSPISGNWWAVEPELGRVAHGIPNRVDRLKCLGNAIVPQAAFEIIRVIKEIESWS